jgi:PAS domain S-box-containing protein
MKRISLPQFAVFNTARARLALLVLLVFIPALGLQVFEAWRDLQTNIEAQRNTSLRVIDHAQGDFENLIKSTRLVIADLVRVNDMRSPNNCTQVFTDLRFAYERLAPQVTNLGLADVHGNIYCAINPVQDDRNIAGQPDFQAALKTIDLSLGIYTRNSDSGSPWMRISYPVLSFNGDVQTVIFLTIDTSWLTTWESEVMLPPGSTVTLFAPDGQVLWRTVNGEVVPVEGLSSNQVQWYSRLHNAGSSTIEAPDFDGIVRLNAMLPLQENGQVVGTIHLGYPVSQLYDQVYARLRSQIGLMALLAIIALLLGWWGSEVMFLRPLSHLLGVVKRVQSGDLDARVVGVRGLGELNSLAHSFDQMTDALQRRDAERRQSETRFKVVFENAAVGMAMMSLDRKIININQASARMTGYSLDELVDTDPSRLSFPDDREIGLAQFRAMIAGEIPGFQMEKRFVRKDGNIFWGRVTYSSVPDLKGQPGYLVGIIEDVTEERINAEKVEIQAAEYRRQLEQRVAERTNELNIANERLRDKAAQDAVIAERTRLARDLHDAVTQTLFSTTLIADVLPDLWEMNMAEGKRRLEELRVLTRGALAEMRTLLVELRPNALVEVPLPTLLRQLVDALAGRSGINIQISVEGERKLPADVQVGLYRIAQEALNNVVKHAKASEAVITLRMGEIVRLTVADSGKGFDPSIVTADHLGLKIMRERADAIGAKLSIYSDPGEGTQISVVWEVK